MIQGGIARTGDRSDAAREEKTRRYLDLTDRIVSADTSLIVWPEYALESYIQEPTRDRAAVLALSRRLHADLVLGGPRYDVIGRAVRYYNAAFLVRDGRVVAHEDKVQLLPLAELGVLGLGAGRAKYAPGNRHEVLPVRGSRLGTFLCWESMHPHLVRDVAVDADILANLSNDDWFGHPFPARHQLDIARFRAIENRRVLVRATATGFSAVVDPQGRIVAISGFGGSPEALQALVQPSRESTPYQHVGDALCWLALVVVIGTSGYAARRPRPIV